MEVSREQDPLASNSEWIGPTLCDENRTSREKDVENVWAIVKPSIENLAKNPKIILLSLSIEPTDLFREATSCYQNGAYLASCALCRTSIESLFYVILSKEITSDSSAQTRTNYVYSKRGELLRKIVQNGLLDNEDTNIVNKIWDEGDFALHYSQNIDRTYVELRRKNLEPKYWRGKSDALDILNKTSSIIAKILQRWSLTYTNNSSNR